MPAELQQQYNDSLAAALDVGSKILAEGGTSLDAVEAVVVALEDNPLFNAGRGAAFDCEGGHSLDASIMNGETLACGAVAGVARLKNPIRGARLVMQESPHVLLMGASADEFCVAKGATTVEPNYYSTERSFAKLQARAKLRGETAPAAPKHGWPSLGDSVGPAHGVDGTVGCVALDTHGHLAAATSTGGLTGKMLGRVGDSPIVGAGTYANKLVAVSCTGEGEQYIRHTIAVRVAMLTEHAGMTVDQAVQHCLTQVLRPDDGGMIAVDSRGNISIRTNTGGMPHAMADSSGKRVVGLWPE
jgi:beta-aspartyl-peptidase (threonine type)